MNTTKAIFTGCETFAIAAPALWQYDYGQILQIEGLELPTAYQVEFSNSAERGETVAAIGDETGVEIPNELLQTGTNIYAFVFLHNAETDGETEYKITIYVTPRPNRPDDTPTPEQETAIDQAIAALNDAVERADASAEAAAGSATSAADSAERAAESATMAEAESFIAGNYADQALNSERAAKAYSEAAGRSQNSAAGSATAAAGSATTAAASATAAAGSAESAAQSAADAQTAAQSAAGAATTAAGSATTAAGSATTAAQEAARAKESADDVAETAEELEIMAQSMIEVRLAAEQSASEAAQSATDAAGSAAAAADSEAEAQRIEAALEPLNGLPGRVGTLETEMDAAQTDITALDGRVTTLEEELGFALYPAWVTGSYTSYGYQDTPARKRTDKLPAGRYSAAINADYVLGAVEFVSDTRGVNIVKSESGGRYYFESAGEIILNTRRADSTSIAAMTDAEINAIWQLKGEPITDRVAELEEAVDGYGAAAQPAAGTDMVATRSIANGEYFAAGYGLYQATAAIAAGETIVPGTNCTQTSSAAALNALRSGKQDQLTFDSTPTAGSSNPVTSGGVAAAVAEIDGEVSDLKSSFDDVTEDYGSSEETVVVPVELDLSDVRVDSFTADQVGQPMNLSTSTVTTAVIRAFLCEANKTYTLTITNGATPARIADRATVVITTPETSNATVTWVQRSTNSANAQDVVEFTPTVSGYVYFNLDKNYQCIAVTTTETQPTTEKTAVDKVARDKLAEITETYVDGDVAVPVELDLSYTRIGYRTNDSIGSSVSLDTTHNTGFNSSDVTSCVARCFECEAGKKYRLTVTNGTTPASIAERATVVIVEPVPNKYYGDIVYVLRSRNTSAVKDTLDFTAPNSGYVFFNVDKNYQSVEVAELQDNIVTTAVDDMARNSIEGVSKYVLNGQVEKTLTWESGSFDASLADVSGSGYRSDVITGVNGCAVCIKVDPSYSFVYGDGQNALMTVYGIYVIHPETDTIRLGLSDTPETVGFEMRVYTERGHKGKYDVIVAASDSSDEDKAIADIVCDGVNDELDLQFAVNWNFWRRQRTIYADRCAVLLLTGTYNIDSFTQQYSANGQLMRNRYGVVFGNHPYNNYQHYKYRVSIEGCYETEHSQEFSSVVINVTAAALATLSTEINNAVFGLALSADGETGSFTSNGMSMVIKNLMIYTRGVANKIIAIDAYQAGNVVVKDCDIWATSGSAYLPSATIETTPEGSIGIRAGRGSCMGVRQRIEGCRINGFHEGIALCGEHFIVQNCLELACYYGFTLNNYPTNGAVQHPNVFIGNSIEQCLNMAKFVESGNNATIVYIGGSVENKLTQDSPAVPMKPIEIAQTTQFRGRIESDGLASPYSNSFFYEGYGSTFEQTIYPFWQA